MRWLVQRLAQLLQMRDYRLLAGVCVKACTQLAMIKLCNRWLSMWHGLKRTVLLVQQLCHSDPLWCQNLFVCEHIL